MCLAITPAAATVAATLLALASLPAILASQSVFSVNDDLLAYPQYEVLFSKSPISDLDVDFIIEQASAVTHDLPQRSNTQSIESHSDSPSSSNPDDYHIFDPSRESYEFMTLHGERHLCTIPVVEQPVRNETSEAEARAAEQKELARATDRGWELLQDLEGNCLYFVSGWWSYSFCYNADIVQFHQLPAKAGQATPIPDPNSMKFVLGRAQPLRKKESKQDEQGNQLDVRKEQKREPPKTELQVKGDTRYLVQKMEGGTTCDLTGKPRRVEVQFHCSSLNADRIGYIKEVQTCSYLMVIYTPRLCNDVAFLPPKETKANPIVCHAIVPEDQVSYHQGRKTLQTQLDEDSAESVNNIVTVGGLVLGAGKWVNKEGQRMPIPANFGQEKSAVSVDIIAQAKSKAEGGNVEMASNADLAKLNLDPEMIQQLRKEVQKLAKEKGWQIKVINEPGQVTKIEGVVDDDEDDEEEEGSEEIFKDEL